MKTFIIEEKFVGYADITIEAETEEQAIQIYKDGNYKDCLLYTSPSPRDKRLSRMPSSA